MVSQCYRTALALAALSALALPGAAGKRLALTSGAQSGRGGGSEAPIALHSVQSIISKPHFDQRLRACNAYTHNTPLSIFHVKHFDKGAGENLTSGGMLAYKQCQDFPIKLGRGDTMEFLQNGSHLGTFSVSALPRRDALLLLVIHRRDKESPVAKFSSHVFSNVPHPQVATLDVYQGSPSHHFAIRDADNQLDGEKKELRRLENLEFDSVVAVGSGKYDCVLLGGVKESTSVPFVASGAESYVLMRVGTEGKPGFPEEVVLFPNPSLAFRNGIPGALSFLLLSLFFWGM